MSIASRTTAIKFAQKVDGISLVNAGDWSSTTNYEFSDNIRPYVRYAPTGKYYLRTSKGSCYNQNPQDDTSNKYWKYTQEWDLILARKIQANEIDTSSLIAKMLKTAANGARIEIFGNNLYGYNNAGKCNIEFGIDEEYNCACFKFYDNDGHLSLILSPYGIKELGLSANKMTATNLYLVAEYAAYSFSYFDGMWTKQLTYPQTAACKFVPGQPISDAEAEAAKYTYTSVKMSVAGLPIGDKIPDGWYCDFTKMSHSVDFEAITVIPHVPDDAFEGNMVSGGHLNIDGSYITYLFSYRVNRYKNGIVIDTKRVYWNSTEKNPGFERPTDK